MQRHEADPRVQREARIALVKLAWDNARIEELGELGAVSACLRAMQTHEKNESVQTPGTSLGAGAQAQRSRRAAGLVLT